MNAGKIKSVIQDCHKERLLTEQQEVTEKETISIQSTVLNNKSNIKTTKMKQEFKIIIILLFIIVIAILAKNVTYSTEVSSIDRDDIGIIGHKYDKNLNKDILMTNLNDSLIMIEKSTIYPGEDYILAVKYREFFGYKMIAKKKYLRIDEEKLITLNNKDFEFILWTH